MTGTIILPEGVVLPEGATWSVELQDTSLADAPAVTIGQAGESITDLTVTAIAFEIGYDESLIDPAAVHTLQARIEDAEDTLLFVNDTVIAVITGGAPTEDVDVPVIAVQAEPGEVMASEPGESPAPVESVAP